MSGATLNRLAKSGALATPDTCEGCDEDWFFGGWQIHHGWARCGRCGTEYCIINYEDDERYNGPTMVFTEKFAKIVREFYADHKKRWDKNPEEFDDYLERHHEKLSNALETGNQEQ